MGRYTEHPLPPALAAVGAVWSYRPGPADADRPPAGVRVLPDGHSDLIVRLAVGPAGVRLESADMTGPTDRPKLLPAPTAGALVGVRLRLGWTAAAVGVDPADLFRAGCGVRECGPGPAALLDRLAACSTVRECATALAEGVASLAMSRRPGRAAERGRWAADRVAGGAAVGGLARRLGVSERTVHRDVLAATGLPPRSLSRVRRFQAAVAMLRAGGSSVASVAAACGYADQPHLTREVRRFAGLPPAALVAAGRGGELQV